MTTKWEPKSEHQLGNLMSLITNLTGALDQSLVRSVVHIRAHGDGG